MGAFVDQPSLPPPVARTRQALGKSKPVELPGSDCTSGLLFTPRPMALAAPKPVEGAGLLLLPIARLSNVQAVRVVAALAPDNEAKIIVVMQTNLLIFVFSCVLLTVGPQLSPNVLRSNVGNVTIR